MWAKPWGMNRFLLKSVALFICLSPSVGIEWLAESKTRPKLRFHVYNVINNVTSMNLIKKKKRFPKLSLWHVMMWDVKKYVDKLCILLELILDEFKAFGLKKSSYCDF